MTINFLHLLNAKKEILFKDKCHVRQLYSYFQLGFQP